MASAITMMVVIGVPAGVIAGANQGRWPDLLLSGFVVALLAIPNFWLGLVLIAVFSVELRWLPSFGPTGPRR